MPRYRHRITDIEYEYSNSIIYEDVCELYKHFTYIVSIFGSIAIYFNSFYVERCGDNYQNYINYIVLLKCFCLYGSSPLELIHHVVQFALILMVGKFEICNDDTFYSIQKMNKIFITPVFQNIKFYFQIPKESIIYTSLDLMFVLTFVYYRLQFNYGIWSGIFYRGINFAIEENNFIFKDTAKTICNSGCYIVSLMNVYWMFLIIKKVYKKYNKTLKDE